MPLRKVPHRFLHHKINPDTEILIIGTFNPEAEGNDADFFYGRVKNHLWNLLPQAFGNTSLKGKSKEEKLSFIKTYKVDFVDVISEVEVDDGSEANYNDDYLDSRITTESLIVEELGNL